MDQGALTEHDLIRVQPKAPVPRSSAGDKASRLTGVSLLSKTKFSIEIEYYDTVRDRLMAAPVTQADRAAARSVWLEVIRWGGLSGAPCQKTAKELSALMGIDAGEMSRILALLKSVGAIARVRRGREKPITAPEWIRPEAEAA